MTRVALFRAGQEFSRFEMYGTLKQMLEQISRRAIPGSFAIRIEDLSGFGCCMMIAEHGGDTSIEEGLALQKLHAPKRKFKWDREEGD